MVKIWDKDFKLSLMMIVKDEYTELENALNSVEAYVDEVVVGWNGSDPLTEAMLKKHQCRYFHFDWKGDFSYARNLVMEQCTGDFLMWLDTDDIVVSPENIARVCAEGFKYNYVGAIWCDYNYDHDKDGNCVMVVKRERIVRRGFFKWVGRLHETMLQVMDTQHYMTDAFHIKHLATSEQIHDSGMRNLKIIEEQYHQEHANDSVDPRTVYDYARSMCAIGEEVQSIKFFKEFIAIGGCDDDRCWAYDRMAEICRKYHRYEESKEYSANLVRLKPTWPDGYLGLGFTYFCEEQWDEAIALLTMGALMEPTKTMPIDPMKYKSKPMRYLAWSYFQSGQTKLALNAAERALAFNPTNEFLLTLKENCLKMQKQEDIARHLIELKKELELTGDTEKLRHLAHAVPEYIKDHPIFIRLRNLYSGNIKNNRIVLFCGPTAEGWSPLSVKAGIGGSEEAVIHISRELAAMGWNIDVYCSCSAPGVYDGVEWHNYWEYIKDEKCDIFIAWRMPLYLDYAPKDARKFLWLHDKQKMEYYTPERIEGVEKIFALSDYHRRDLPQIADRKFMITSNGIVGKHFEGIYEKSKYSFIYASSPDRGLDIVLDYWPKIREQFPEAVLHIFYGFTKNFDEVHKNDENGMKFKTDTMNLIKKLENNGVIYHGRVGHLELADAFLHSSWWLYPTYFEEISCITGMKAQAAGCWPICSNYAALAETVKYGDIIKGKGSEGDFNERWFKALVDRVKKGITKEEMAEMRGWAIKHYSWSTVANQWNQLFGGKDVRLSSTTA